jgi:hypothetical protein
MRPPAGRAVVAALLSLAVAAVSAPTASAAVDRQSSPSRVIGALGVPRHGTGLVPPSTRIDAASVLGLRGRVAYSLPASVDLSANAPAVGDQGQLGSCATWAIGYGILGYYSKTQPHAGAPFAALSLYNQVNGGGDNGSTSSDIFSVLQSKGIVEQAVWTHGPTDYTSQPNTTEAANGLTHKTSGGSYLFAQPNQGAAATTAIETALAAGTPVAIGIPVYTAFYSLTSTNSVMTNAKVSGTLQGYHMVAAYGYDSTGVKIANSWGTGWGKSGWATLGWDFVDKYAIEASTPKAFVKATAVGAPTVTSVDPKKASTVGGGTLTVKGTNLADATSVTAAFVNAQDPSKTYPLTSVSAGGSVLTGTIPANIPEGAYRVVVTNSYGSNPDTAADDFTFVAVPTFSISSTVVPATGGKVTVTGTGFGNAASAFVSRGYSATVDGKVAALSWLSDTSLTLTVPGGVPGKKPSIVLSRVGYSSAPNTASVTYGAVITAAVASTDASGPVLRLSGKGFANSTGWTLTSDADGTNTTSLPAASDSSSVGVVVQSDTTATVRLPIAPGPVGAYDLSFTPNTTTYPGAVFVDTPAAHYTYKLPTIISATTNRASTAGGTQVVYKGTGLLAVDTGSSTAVKVVLVADPTKTVNATVTQRTDTALSVTLPAALLSNGTGSAPIEGAYRLVVTTPLGAPAVSNSADLITYLKPYAVSVANGTVVPAAGGAVKVTGSGFGATRTDFTAAKVTATVSGRAAGVMWISDSVISVTMPPGTPGASVPIVILRDTVPSPAVNVTYVAVVTGLSVTTGPTAGGTLVTVSGKGFAGSSVWKVKAMDGTTLATLAPTSGWDGVDAGVLVMSDTRAVVKMPAVAEFGAVYLDVTPDQTLYPNAAYAPTSKSVFVYSDLG